MQQNPTNVSGQAGKLLSLSEFIIQNDKLLAAIGIFIALAAYWTTLPFKKISAFLALLCLLAVIPLFFEIWRQVLTKKLTLNLIVFINIFTLITGYTFYYLLIGFRPQWQTEMNQLIFWILVLPTWYGLKYFDRRFKFSLFGEKIIRITDIFASTIFNFIMLRVDYYIRHIGSTREVRKQKWELMQNYESPPPKEWTVRIILKGILIVILFVGGNFTSDLISPLINLSLDEIAKKYSDNNVAGPSVEEPVP
jgi:hypothetical protein